MSSPTSSESRNFGLVKRRASRVVVRRRLDQLAAVSKEFGPTYTALSAVQRVIEDQLLKVEGRRGVLGPAHLRHHGNSPASNRDVWSSWDWTASGEEWSESPGWKESLVAEVLLPSMPRGGRLLEVGPGGGRWTEILVDHGEHLTVVDVSPTALELCRKRFGDGDNIDYRQTDGTALDGVPDGTIDGLWSFDVFVHIAPADIASYLEEIARVLRPGAPAVIHHAGRREPRAWRSPMSARLFRNLATSRGLEVERQFDSWDNGRFAVPPYGDVISALRVPDRALETP